SPGRARTGPLGVGDGADDRLEVGRVQDVRQRIDQRADGSVRRRRPREILGVRLARARLQRIRLDVGEIKFLVWKNHRRRSNTKDTKDNKVNPKDPQTISASVTSVSSHVGQRTD